MREDARFPTIRQCARRGPFTEHQLRLMQHRGELPGFYVGNHYRVDYDGMIAIIKQKCAESVAGDKA